MSQRLSRVKGQLIMKNSPLPGLHRDPDETEPNETEPNETEPNETGP